MHIIFLNPQGNFDAKDSYLAEHPDFGGQLVYVKELAVQMAELGHKVDIVTRRVVDDDWPEFEGRQEYYPGYEGNPRILRFDCGGPEFIGKEKLWPHMDEFIRNVVSFYGEEMPDFATAHYADGGYCAVLFNQLTGIPFSFTGHSLGAQKLDKLGMNAQNRDEMEEKYRFSARIAAERMAMENASIIFTSTDQERSVQYGHDLYHGAVDPDEPGKFAVIPPGVNMKIFSSQTQEGDAEIQKKLPDNKDKPCVIVSSRLDEKKNILGVAKAFAGSEELRDKARPVICIRGIDDPYQELENLSGPERKVLASILEVIDRAGMRDEVIWLNLQSQQELAATYRHFAAGGSVFALTAFYEPFGLAPIEAAATGLACVATKNGGPSEIFEDGSGILVDPFDADDIAAGLLRALEQSCELAAMAQARVKAKYTWRKTAESYLSVIDKVAQKPSSGQVSLGKLDAGGLLAEYLKAV